MYQILHALQISAPIEQVFEAITSPSGLNHWWTLECSGVPLENQTYRFVFSKDCIWSGRVTQYSPVQAIEWLMTDAQEDWENTRVGLSLSAEGHKTNVDFYHSGWKSTNKHFRVSSYCWATYLRVLKLYLEKGVETPYEQRDLV